MLHIESLESRVQFSAGGVDDSFGISGQIATPVGNSAVNVSAITALPSGKFIITGGSAERKNNPAGTVMVRYLDRGVIDHGFGNNGRVALTLNGKPVSVESQAATPNGGMLILENTVGQKQFLVRYNADGSLNTNFGVGGKVSMPTGTSAAKITFDGNGNIIIGTDYLPPAPNGAVFVDGPGSLELLRLSASGKRDQNFGSAGVVVTPFQFHTWTPNIQPLADGKIMALIESGPGISVGSVVRFNADGTLDTSYNASGIAPLASISTPTDTGGQLVGIPNPVLNVAAQFQSDGSVDVAYSDGQKDNLFVTRITAAGKTDATFGTQGVTSLPFTNAPLGVFVEPDGDCVVVANTFRVEVPVTLVMPDVAEQEYDSVGIARLTSTGAPDPTFGNNGIAVNNNSPAIGANTAAFDGSQLLIEPAMFGQTKLAVAAYSI